LTFCQTEDKDMTWKKDLTCMTCCLEGWKARLSSQDLLLELDGRSVHVLDCCREGLKDDQDMSKAILLKESLSCTGLGHADWTGLVARPCPNHVDLCWTGGQSMSDPFFLEKLMARPLPGHAEFALKAC